MNRRLKLLTLLFILILVASLAACNDKNTDEDTPAPSGFDIYTAEDLLAVSEMVGDKYSDTVFNLKNDIDLADITFTPIGYDFEHAFTGTFAGNGFTISNLKINSSQEKTGGGLFGYIKDAYIYDLTIQDADIDYTATEQITYTGGLFGYGYGSNIVSDISISGNIRVKNTVKIRTSTTSGLPIEECGQSIYAGGVLGYNMGSLILERAVCGVNIFILPTPSSDETKEIPFRNAFIGGGIGFITGMDGTIDSNLNQITVDAEIIDTAATHSFTAGLAGYLSNTSLTNSTAEIDEIIMKGDQAGTRANAGGISAYTLNSIIEKVSVKNTVFDTYNIFSPSDIINLGGIVGYADKTKLRFSHAENVTLVASKVTYSGGIAGVLRYSRTMNDSTDADAGLEPQGYSLMENCSATGGLYAYRNNNALIPIPAPVKDNDYNYDGSASIVGLIWGDSQIENCFTDFVSVYGVVAEIRMEEGVDTDGNPIAEKRSEPEIGVQCYYSKNAVLSLSAGYSENLNKSEQYPLNAICPCDIEDYIAALTEE